MKNLFQKAGVSPEQVATAHIGHMVELDVIVITDRPEAHPSVEWGEVAKYPCWKLVILATMFRQTHDAVRFDVYGVVAWVDNSPEADIIGHMIRQMIGRPIIDTSNDTIH